MKQKIDEKQDKMLEQLQKNQRAITSGLEDLTMLQQLPDVPPQTTKLPIDYKPAMLEPQFKSDMDTGFSIDKVKKLTEYKLAPPSQVLQGSMKGDIDINDYDKSIGKKLHKLGSEKGSLSKGVGKKKK